MAKGTQQQHFEHPCTSHPFGKVLGCQVSQDPHTQVLHRSSMCLPAATRWEGSSSSLQNNSLWRPRLLFWGDDRGARRP